MTVQVKYFAWVRERIGLREEEIDIPADVKTVRDFLLWLRGRGDGYAEALRQPEVIRVAINQEHADHKEQLGSPREIALFPPMTGG